MIRLSFFQIFTIFALLTHHHTSFGSPPHPLKATTGWESFSDLRSEINKGELKKCLSVSGKMGSCDLALDRIKFLSDSMRSSLNLGDSVTSPTSFLNQSDSVTSPTSSKSSQSCQESNPPWPVVLKTTQMLDEVNKVIIDDQIPNRELRARLNTTSLSQKEVIDNRIKQLIQRKQSSIITPVCGKMVSSTDSSLEEPYANRDTAIDALIKSSTEASSLKCLRKISELWRDTKAVKNILKNDKVISNYLKTTDEPKLAETFLAMSYLKNMRAKIATSYFQNVLPTHLSNKLGIPHEEVIQNFTGFGFNRLFSPKNFMGASPTSDVDFNLVFDDSKISKVTATDPKERAKQIAAFQEKTLAALEESKKRFFDALSLPLEVNSKYSVKPLSGVRAGLEDRGPGGEGPKNFMATLSGNEVHLFGSSALKNEIIRTVKSAIPDNEIESRVYQQYIGEKSLKGSLEIIRHIDRVADPHMHETFAGNYIGMPQNKGPEHSGEWTFSTKYALMRLFDTKPEDPRTRRLNDIGLNFQYLLVDLLTKRGVSDAEIEKKYDKITASDFSEVYKKDPGTIHAIVRVTCRDRLISESLCNEFESLQENETYRDKEKSKSTSSLNSSSRSQSTSILSKRWSKAPDALTRELGEKYFTEIFNQAASVAEDLNPKSSSK